MTSRSPHMRIISILVTALLLLAASPSPAQEKQPLVTRENEIEAARKMMAQERKLVIAGELVLTPAESEAFWPIFNEYQAEVRKIGDARVALITEFAENYSSADDEFAERMLKESLDIETRELKLRKKYLKRFKQALPTLKVAKFYQVENKLNAVIDYQLAAQIPMIGN
jgi:hypothetical protein